MRVVDRRLELEAARFEKQLNRYLERLSEDTHETSRAQQRMEVNACQA